MEEFAPQISNSDQGCISYFLLARSVLQSHVKPQGKPQGNVSCTYREQSPSQAQQAQCNCNKKPFPISKGNATWDIQMGRSVMHLPTDLLSLPTAYLFVQVTALWGQCQVNQPHHHWPLEDEQDLLCFLDILLVVPSRGIFWQFSFAQI